MKRLLCGFLAAALLLTATACGSGTTQAQSESQVSPQSASAQAEPATAPSGDYADIVIQNGLVYTADSAGTTAEAVGVRDGVIVFVGDGVEADALIGPETEVIDLDGGMALPGFIDGHGHPCMMASELFNLDLSAGSGPEDYLQAVRDYSEQNPALEIITGFGWAVTAFGDASPTKEMLDEIRSDIPIMLNDAGYHIKWLNSKALEVAGITKDSPIPEGAKVDKDENGEPTGLVTDYPQLNSVFSGYTPEQFEEALLKSQAVGHSYGLTSYFDDTNVSGFELVDAYNRLEQDGKLQMRTALFLRLPDIDNPIESVERIAAARDGTVGGLFQIQGVKVLLDGVIEGRTGYLEEAYADEAGFIGNNKWEGKDEQFAAMCKRADDLGLDLHFHAIGDRAVRVALDQIEQVRGGGRTGARHGITHGQLVNEADFARFQELGVTFVPQSFWFAPGADYEQAIEFLGQERADRQYPLASFFEAGALVSAGSDYPVQTNRPLIAIEMAITRRRIGQPLDAPALPPESESATLDQMLRAYTINGAQAYNLEEEVGSLEIGKRADILVLDQNLFTLPANQIAQTQERITIFDGEIVYRAA